VTVACQFRQGRAADAADLAALIDIASRGLLNWFWGTLCAQGESAFDKGRSRIKGKTESPAFCENWTVAEAAGETAGGFTGYRVSKPFDTSEIKALPDLYAPMLELEAQAAGTWFLMAIAVFAEFRSLGIGGAMLNEAEGQARQAGATQVSILVESANPRAERFYHRAGFREFARRPYIPFPGSRDDGDWVLLMKEVAG
jgi:ribosomal protein S18 acetylase RimI-like enzyme